MTPKTPASGWTAKRRLALAALALVGVFAAGVALSPPRDPGVAVIGDRADALRAALGDLPQGDPTVTIVTIARWDNLRHLPDIAETCWDACHNRVAGHITLTRMRFGATQKTVVFHLPSFGGDMACIAARARQELSRLRADAPCAPQVARRAVWILPMGLGRI
ncbi:hypothetical protein KDD17_01825 [Sulfitobacter albidus]|uniref:Uncharacterized protein n=1 Tax=Sulfitobacter albidus TaxID=2829501 RepID=A0A975JEL8_9RHOB|nr:hypothetical protein [Sulfitobacter albidus]QUJ76826.1 hypothetical protein KDD17_01825 [Sulfitobacter albidus]